MLNPRLPGLLDTITKGQGRFTSANPPNRPPLHTNNISTDKMGSFHIFRAAYQFFFSCTMNHGIPHTFKNPLTCKILAWFWYCSHKSAYGQKMSDPDLKGHLRSKGQNGVNQSLRARYIRTYTYFSHIGTPPREREIEKKNMAD